MMGVFPSGPWRRRFSVAWSCCSGATATVSVRRPSWLLFIFRHCLIFFRPGVYPVAEITDLDVSVDLSFQEVLNRFVLKQSRIYTEFLGCQLVELVRIVL